MDHKPSESKLSVDEVIERLEIKDQDIIQTAYTLCYDLVKQEIDRQGSLDSKANNFLGLISLYITLVFGFGGLILSKIDSPSWVFLFVILYLASLLFSFAALYFSFKSLKARGDYRSISDEDIFNRDVLKGDLGEYKQFLTVHFWMVYQNNFRINQIKGRELQKAARMFLCSSLFLLALILVLSSYALLKGGL